jgi:argininosuccinate synthase
MQVDDIINSAAKEYRVYHYNGGQVFIRLSALDNMMMVIDHSVQGNITVELFDGTKYLAAYTHYNTEYSKRFIAEPSQLAVVFA